MRKKIKVFIGWGGSETCRKFSIIIKDLLKEVFKGKEKHLEFLNDEKIESGRDWIKALFNMLWDADVAIFCFNPETERHEESFMKIEMSVIGAINEYNKRESKKAIPLIPLFHEIDKYPEHYKNIISSHIHHTKLNENSQNNFYKEVVIPINELLKEKNEDLSQEELIPSKKKETWEKYYKKLDELNYDNVEKSMSEHEELTKYLKKIEGKIGKLAPPKPHDIIDNVVIENLSKIFPFLPPVEKEPVEIYAKTEKEIKYDKDNINVSYQISQNPITEWLGYLENIAKIIGNIFDAEVCYIYLNSEDRPDDLICMATSSEVYKDAMVLKPKTQYFKPSTDRPETFTYTIFQQGIATNVKEDDIPKLIKRRIWTGSTDVEQGRISEHGNPYKNGMASALLTIDNEEKKVESIGVIKVENKNQGKEIPFNDQELALLRIISAILGDRIAIHRKGMKDNFKKKCMALKEEIAKKRVNSGRELTSFFKKECSKIEEIFSVEGVDLYFYKKQDNRLSIVAASGIFGDLTKSWNDLPEIEKNKLLEIGKQQGKSDKEVQLDRPANYLLTEDLVSLIYNQKKSRKFNTAEELEEFIKAAKYFKKGNLDRKYKDNSEFKNLMLAVILNQKGQESAYGVLRIKNKTNFIFFNKEEEIMLNEIAKSIGIFYEKHENKAFMQK